MFLAYYPYLNDYSFYIYNPNNNINILKNKTVFHQVMDKGKQTQLMKDL